MLEAAIEAANYASDDAVDALGLDRDTSADEGAYLAELITYFALDDDAFDVVFDEVAEQIRWEDDDGRVRLATVPRVTYARREEVR